MGIGIIGDNIVSSLGFTTDENVAAVRRGDSGLRYYADAWGVPEPLVASAVSRERLDEVAGQWDLSKEKYTHFERLAIVSMAEAIREAGVDMKSRRTLFILSTTKGNVELLASPENDSFETERCYLWHTARLIAGFFGHVNEPVVVSNACISGVAALIVAKRWLEMGVYDTAVVVGVDVLSKFIISGFQSFKALSPEPCRPFDAARCGLNLGEAAATVILQRCAEQSGKVLLAAGAISNDANHISGPSRTGEGLFLALESVLKGTDIGRIGFINAHGTATLYNDEMESIAFDRAGLLQVPVYSLKAYFGHTLGAAGVLESLISARALRDGFLPVSRGYVNGGVSRPVRVVTEVVEQNMEECIKTVSGFGGCNAAIRLKIE